MLELEKTYLAKKLPESLKTCDFKEIIDIYIPKEKDHPKLRLRKNGNKYEITKKTPIDSNDKSRQEEQTIILSEEEFNSLNKQIDGKRVHKRRYYYPYKERIAEIDIFQGDLKGLVVIDFEFEKTQEIENFEMPSFCLVDITQEVFIAGGMLCGKKYEDIETNLEKFAYKKLFLE
jgi:adenylate cyclase